MKKTILHLLICLTTVSCAPEKDTEISLFNNVSFKLSENETITKIDTEKKKEFRSFFEKKAIQIPLFRCIKGDNYLIFIGIPFNTSVKELTEYGMNKELKNITSKSDSTQYTYQSYSTKNTIVSTYAQNFDDNIVYILTASNSPKLSDSLFNIEMLSSRFNQ